MIVTKQYHVNLQTELQIIQVSRRFIIFLGKILIKAHFTYCSKIKVCVTLIYESIEGKKRKKKRRTNHKWICIWLWNCQLESGSKTDSEFSFTNGKTNDTTWVAHLFWVETTQLYFRTFSVTRSGKWNKEGSNAMIKLCFALDNWTDCLIYTLHTICA